MALYLRGDTWWFKFRLPGERKPRRVSTDVRGAKNRGAAQLRTAEIITEAKKHADERTASTARKPPLDLVNEYERYLAGVRKRSALHVEITTRRLRRIFEGVPKLDELDVRAALERVSVTTRQGFKTGEKTPERKELLPQTRNYYRLALSAFFNWLVREERWPKNPVKVVEKSEEVESEARRAFTAEELERLLATTPPARSALYRLAATSGLRRSELRSLTWGDVDLDAGTVTVRRRFAKNRKEETLPLAEGTIQALREHKARAEEDRRKALEKVAYLDGDPASVPPLEVSRVFKVMPLMKTFYWDLERAKDSNGKGIPVETADGKLVFHSLRATLATLLARADVSLVMAQRLMRHSDPKLTANVYTKFQLHDGRAAVARIDVGVVKAERSRSARKEGTSGGTVDEEGPGTRTVLEPAGANGRSENPGVPGSIPGPSIRPTDSGLGVSVPEPEAPGTLTTRPRKSRKRVQENACEAQPGAQLVRVPPEPRANEAMPPQPKPLDLERLARELISLAATSPDPAPMLEVAQRLLSQARAGEGRVIKLGG